MSRSNHVETQRDGYAGRKVRGLLVPSRVWVRSFVVSRAKPGQEDGREMTGAEVIPRIDPGPLLSHPPHNPLHGSNLYTLEHQLLSLQTTIVAIHSVGFVRRAMWQRGNVIQVKRVRTRGGFG